VSRRGVTELAGKLDVLGMGKRLAPEENDFPAQQCIADGFSLIVAERLSQIQALNFSADVDRQRLDG
jgi:hypothetical protein